MEKDKFIEIIKRLCINWDVITTGPPFKERCSVWWRYLSDLPTEDVENAVDQLILLDQQFIPRVGQVRRLAIDLVRNAPIPTSAEAWSQFRTAIEASESGVPFTKPHDLVAKAMRSFPNNGASLRTNADRTLFLQAYDKMVGDEERERYLGGSKQDS